MADSIIRLSPLRFELFIRNQAGYIPFLSNISLEEYCKLNSNSAECKSFCANNPKSCDFTDF